MGIQQNPYPLRIDKTLLNKIKVVAALNGRSANKEIEIRMKSFIEEYETKNGVIYVVPDSTEL